MISKTLAVAMSLLLLTIAPLAMSSEVKNANAVEIEQSPTEPWYVKPSFPDYALSGMPDFDQRQDSWWWRSWAFPDAVAVWQHYDPVYNDWDIYYSIYTDPNMWWTLGCNNARPIVADSPLQVGFLPGHDMQPAISWYSSNYAIAVWQHWTGSDWEIMYSQFTPNTEWSSPRSLAYLPGVNDYDPAIAFDTNGWAVAVWVHGDQPGATVIYYSVWNPNTLSWVGPNNILSGGQWPGNAAMPELDVDSHDNVVTVWTDGPAGQELVYYSWAPLSPPIPPFLTWIPPAAVPGCPLGVNWQKGISPDNLGNNLIDFGLPAPGPGGEPLYYAEFTSPSKTWRIPASQLTVPSTHGEHPDLAFDLNNRAIAVYTSWPNGQIFFSFWNGANWAPVGGAFAASANAQVDQWPAIAFLKNNKAVLVWNAYPEPYGPGWRSEIYYSVYTPPYPPGSWTRAATIMPIGSFLTGDDYYVDIASPTGSPTTPPSVPQNPREPANPVWSWCGPTAVANSIWWFDSKYEPNSVPPPRFSDGFPLVRSYKPLLWDDHDPQNVQPLIQHLAWLMDTDGQRTKLCHTGTNVFDMQAGITQYLSWSGVNPLGDVNGDGEVNATDVTIVNSAMSSTPGAQNWNLAADIYPETETGPRTADNKVDQNDLDLVNRNLGNKGLFYEHTEHAECRTDFFQYIEAEVEKCQDVVLLLGIYEGTRRIYGHYVTVAGVNSTTFELLISNPIRDDFEARVTPGRSPIPHGHLPPEPPYTLHNNASLVSQDAYRVAMDQHYYHWFLERYEENPALTARIEFAVITSPLTEEVHDIAVTDVKPHKTAVSQNYDCIVDVTVTNEGNFNETFDLTLYAFTMPPSTPIETKTISDLLVGETRIITFVWDTTGWSRLTYTISAEASQVTGETHTEDNIFTDGTVTVTVGGDFGNLAGGYYNFDDKCDWEDLFLFRKAYVEQYHVLCDFNNDDSVDYLDLFQFRVCYLAP